MCIDLKEYAHVLKDAAPYCCFKRANCALSLPYKYLFLSFRSLLIHFKLLFFQKAYQQAFLFSISNETFL